MLQRVFESQVRRDHVEMQAVASSDVMANYSAHLRESLRVLRRRRWVIIATLFAVLSAAIAFIVFATPRYTATATVLIDTHRSSVAESDSAQFKQTTAATEDATINSQVLLLQSVAVLTRVVDNLNLTDDPEFRDRWSPVGAIKGLFAAKTEPVPGQSPEEIARTKAVNYLQSKLLKVAREGTSFVINVAVTSERPEQAAKIANAIVDSYFQEQVQSKFDTRKIAVGWFNQQLADLKAKVQESDRAVEQFRGAHNLTVAQGVTVNDQQLTDLNNKLIETHVQTAEARAKYERVENIAKTGADPGALEQALTSDVVARLRTQYADVTKNLADVSSKFGRQHPLVVNARAQQRETKKLIDEEVQRILENTRQIYQVAQSREDALQRSLDNLKNISNESGIEQVRLRELKREADANRILYESFLARFKETNAQETLDLPDARIVSKANIPIQPSFPKTTLIIAFAGVFGLGLGGVLAFLADSADHRIKSLRQAEEITGVPALAAIPLVGPRELANRANRGRSELGRYNPDATQLLPPAMQPPLMRYVLDEPTSLFAESVRAVRLAIQRAGRNEPVKSVLVTSSIDGEGKTTLAVNLALSLAALGKRTILVEGDMRNPEMSRSLAPRAEMGVIEVAAGQVGIDKALLIDRPTGLLVLPSPLKQRPHGINEFVFSETMRVMMERLKEHFDYVVIDSPPLVPLVDARALGDIADRIVLTIRWDSTPRDVLAQAMETIAPDYDHLLGSVLTRVDMQRLRDYDYYRSSSYVRPYSYLGQPRLGGEQS